MQRQFSERERYEAMVKLALESRMDGASKNLEAEDQVNNRVRSLPALDGVLSRAKARQAGVQARQSYTYGL